MDKQNNKTLVPINHESPLPLHSQVETYVRDLIEGEDYQRGKLLPNEIDIAKRLGISRNTVRQAMNKLVHEQLIFRKKGVGTRVVSSNITTKLNKWSSFTLEMHEQGVHFNDFSLKIKWVPAEQPILDLFGLSPGSKVLKLERLRGMSEGPVVHFASYFHPRVGLTGEEDFSKPLYEMLERDYHTVAVISKEEISAILADDHLARILHTKPGEPILLRKRTVCDPGDRPIEYNIGYYRADCFTYAIDIRRG